MKYSALSYSLEEHTTIARIRLHCVLKLQSGFLFFLVSNYIDVQLYDVHLYSVYQCNMP